MWSGGVVSDGPTSQMMKIVKLQAVYPCVGIIWFGKDGAASKPITLQLHLTDRIEHTNYKLKYFICQIENKNLKYCSCEL